MKIPSSNQYRCRWHHRLHSQVSVVEGSFCLRVEHRGPPGWIRRYKWSGNFELSTIIMFNIIVRDDTNTCDLTAGCVGRMIGPPWTGLTPDSNPSLKDECPLFSYLPKWFALLLHLQHQMALPSESSVSGQASSELLKWSQVLLFQSNLTLTWHIQGFLHLFFKLCQLLFGSLIALRTHLTSLKRNVNCK